VGKMRGSWALEKMLDMPDWTACERLVGVMRPLLFNAARITSTSLVLESADLELDEMCMSKVGLPERVAESFDVPVGMEQRLMKFQWLRKALIYMCVIVDTEF